MPGFEIRPRDQHWLLRLIDRVFPYARGMFTTWNGVVYYPVNLDTTNLSMAILIKHESIHVEQQRRLGFWLFLAIYLLWPMPVLFAWGRWRLEREAYLVDIATKRLTIDDAVNVLWARYAWPWPKPLMRRWFRDNTVL